MLLSERVIHQELVFAPLHINQDIKHHGRRTPHIWDREMDDRQRPGCRWLARLCMDFATMFHFRLDDFEDYVKSVVEM